MFKTKDEHRNVIVSDLSPAAQYISYNYNTSIPVSSFYESACKIIDEVEKNAAGFMRLNTTEVMNPSFKQIDWDE